MKLTDEELLRALKHGIYTKLKECEDTELTHYVVLSFNDEELLICFSGISWRDGSTSHLPHIIKQKDKNKKWFFEIPTRKTRAVYGR